MQGTEWFLQNLKDFIFKKICRDCKIININFISFKFTAVINKAYIINEQDESLKRIKKNHV